MSEQKYHTISMRNKYAGMTIREFHDTNAKEVSAFLQVKLSLACEALIEMGLPKNKIAKKLGLASGDSIDMMLHKWGSNAK